MPKKKLFSSKGHTLWWKLFFSQGYILSLQDHRYFLKELHIFIIIIAEIKTNTMAYDTMTFT